MAESIAWRGLRYLYAAYYLYFGIRLTLALIGVLSLPRPKISTASAAFQDALARTGFVLPALAFTYISSACAMLFHRTAPLGVVILAPVIVAISLTDIILDTAWFWGTLHAAILAALAWHFRSAYRPLWNYPVVTTDVRAT